MKVSKIVKEEKVSFDDCGNATTLNTIEVETPIEYCGDDLAALVSTEYQKDTSRCESRSPIYDGDHYWYAEDDVDEISTIVTVYFKKEETENEEELTK